MCETHDLFKSVEHIKPRDPSSTGEKTDLSYSYLKKLRYSAGLALKQKTQNVEFVYKERFRSALAFVDSRDEVYKQWKRVDKVEKRQPVIRQHVAGVEFVTVTVLSAEYLDNIRQKAKDIETERKRRKKQNRRVVDSFVGEGERAGGLGIIGNNLGKVSKPVRDRRYKIQRYIQRYGLSDSQYVCNCGVNISQIVHIKKNQEYGNCNFQGVATCGSVWACPVCRAKIINERTEQLKKIYSEGVQRGYHFSFLTLTFSHKNKDNLARMYGNSNDKTGLSGAITRLRQSYFWSNTFKNKIDYIGDIRAVEITWGTKNGFHPHVHFVIISKKKPDVKNLEEKIYKYWSRYAEKSGLGAPNRKNGVRYESVDSDEQVCYLAKWSVPNELVSVDQKQAKFENYSIAELERSLVDIGYADLMNIDRDKSVNVLKAYYAGMSGQKMLTYGNPQSGWKDDLLGEDLEDEEITREEYQEKMESHVVYMHSDVYKVARKSDLLNEIIESVESIPAGPMYKIKACARVQRILSKRKIPWRGKVFSSFNTVPG